MAIRNREFLEIASEIIKEITGKDETVHIVKNNVSGVNYQCKTIGGYMNHIQVNYFMFGEDSSLEDNIRTSLRSKFLPLLSISFDLFVILHEIGHIMTAKGLNYNMVENERKMFQKYAKLNLKPSTVARRYRQTIQESKADEFAYDWMVNNPERVAYYAEKLKRALS